MIQLGTIKLLQKDTEQIQLAVVRNVGESLSEIKYEDNLFDKVIMLGHLKKSISRHLSKLVVKDRRKASESSKSLDECI